jgi:predicted membrane-bound spermidine synthase
VTSRHGLFALAFGSGFAVLTIEIAGARMIAPVFGLSVVPWTAVIGVILGALAIGSHLGGRLADSGRVPLSRVLMAAGVTGALPVIGMGVPWFARDTFGFIPGAVVSALVLFAPPVLCLGAVVPFLIRADTHDLAQVGRRAGDMSAAATAGSILGSFVTGFVLLPAMPLPMLLGGTAGALLLMALVSVRLVAGDAGGAGGSGKGAGLVLAAIALPSLGFLASTLPPDTLFAEQTLYSSLAVTERPWADGRLVRELWQNGGSSSAEYASGEPAHTYAVASLEIVEDRLDSVERILVLGGAGLTLPVAFLERHPAAIVDVVEIDPEVTRVASTYFAFGRAPRPGIRVVHDDARVVLRASDATYDLVYLDVFDHLLTVPWTMVTREALEGISARLAPDGWFMANVLSPVAGPGTAFLERFRATLESEFGDVRVYLTDPALDPGATQNLVVVAAHARGTIPDLPWMDVGVPARGRPLTDAWAPVEYLQARVFMQGLRWR